MSTLGIRAACSCLRFLYFFLKLVPTRKKITFISKLGDGPSVDFALLQAELEALLPDYAFATKCRRFSSGLGSLLRYAPAMLVQMFHIATSRLVILDSYCIPISILSHKRGLKVVQIWHALGLMKKIGYAAVGTEEGWSKENARVLSMHKGYTHILVSSEAAKDARLRCFGYTESPSEGRKAHPLPLEEALIGALPRVDLLQDEEAKSAARSAVYAAYPFLRDKKVILYVPTLRKNNDELPGRIRELVEAVNEANREHGEYALVIKPHPRQRKNWKNQSGDSYESPTEGPASQGSCVLFDKRFSTTEIGMVAWACVSDYSSLIFESMLLGLPTYFFAFDLDRYEHERGLIIDYAHEMPGGIHRDARSLVAALVHERHSPQEQQAFLAKYVSFNDGGNARSLAQSIVRIIEGSSKG